MTAEQAEGFHADYHLAPQERNQMNLLLQSEKYRIVSSTFVQLEKLIRRDYAEANWQLLGGFDGIILLQRKLGVKEDGDFSVETFQRLIAYQKEHHLRVDGLAGIETQNSLGILGDISSISSSVSHEQISGGEGIVPHILRKQRKNGNEIGQSGRTDHISYISAIERYDRIVKSLDEQVISLDRQRQDNTGIVGGIGDLIGSTTGAWTTGKEAYEMSMQHLRVQAQKYYDKLLKELHNQPQPTDQIERDRIEVLIGKFQSLTGRKLKEVSWGTAVLNTTLGKSKGQVGPMGDAIEYGARGMAGIAEGSINMMMGAVEMTGKLFGILTAAGIDSDARDQFVRDCASILSKITLENAHKLLSYVSQHIQDIGKLPADDQADAIGKLTGDILAMFGTLGAVRVARAGVSAAQSGTKLAQSGVQNIQQPGARILGATQIISGSTGVVAGKATQIAAISVGTLGPRSSGNMALPGDKGFTKVVTQPHSNITSLENTVSSVVSETPSGHHVPENTNHVVPTESLNINSPPSKIYTTDTIHHNPPQDIPVIPTKPPTPNVVESSVLAYGDIESINISILRNISELKGKYLHKLEREWITEIKEKTWVVNDIERDAELKTFLILKVEQMIQEGKYEAIIFDQSEMSEFVKKFFPNNSVNDTSMGRYGGLDFTKDSHGRYHIDDNSTGFFGRLKYNPLMTGIGEDFLVMMTQSKISFSDEVIARILELNGRYDPRYGNGLSSMTRYISALINKGNVYELFQGGKIPENLEQRLLVYSPQSEYVKIVRDILISATRNHTKDGIGGYSYYQSGLSPRHKGCKDVESYFSDILSYPVYAPKKKYRVIGDFIEKNVDGEQSLRTAISTKEVVVAGIRYPKGYLFRLNTDGREILGVEPVRLTMFSGSNILQDGEKAFGYQYVETKMQIDSNLQNGGGEFQNDMIALFLEKLKDDI